MKRTPPQWLLWFALITLLLNLNDAMLNGRKLTTTSNSHSDFISIDCGANTGYTDPATGISYQADTGFVDTGYNSMVKPDIRSDFDYRYFGTQLQTLRSFPEGRRNCYTLKPKLGKNQNYLIRAFFTYGNYDGKNEAPSFDLYLGTNYWTDVNANRGYVFVETIHTPTTDTIPVCLVKSGKGIPFISTLELRPLSNSIYPAPSPSQSLLSLYRRVDVGCTGTAKYSRYKDDIYDRTWLVDNTSTLTDWHMLSKCVDIDAERTNDSYRLPAQVLLSAAKSSNRSSALNFDSVSAWGGPFEYSFTSYVYFHFAEIEQLPHGQKRVIDITLNDENFLPRPITLEYLKPLTVSTVTNQSYINFSISAASESAAPPILNAFEIYQLMSPLTFPTDQRDVAAIMDIKNTYNISNLDWQGDPCASELAWDGLNCSSGINGNNARITSVNLRATKLTGQITPSFSQLTELETLDLSLNDLSGSIPEFLAKLPKLRVLNLSSNKLMGSIPKSLEGKSYATLQLSLADNPDLCLGDSCNKFVTPPAASVNKHKFVIPLAASVSALAVTFLVSLGVWIFKTKKLKGPKRLKQKKLLHEIRDIAIPFSVSGKRKFSKSDKTAHEIHIFDFKSIVLASDNFSSTNKLGEGGFGPVYKGILLDGRDIAIKRLSKCSKQGLAEFKNEVKLIAKLQHTNLVRLYGVCIEEEEKMLIYEYLPNKSLDFYIFDHNNRTLLDWKSRLNIIQGIAQGLVYLHKYSRLKVIHRDLKPSNILLDQEMCPKISDFGMARIFELQEFEQENTNRVVGTLGYMSPEYAFSGIVSVKTDIFSFGVMLLEIVSGEKNVSFVNSGHSINLIGYAWKLWNEERALQLADPSLSGTWNANELLRCIHVGLLCVQDQAKDRPDMLDVVAYLSNETILLAEPKQPAFFINARENKATSPANIAESCSTYNVTVSDFNGR